MVGSGKRHRPFLDGVTPKTMPSDLWRMIELETPVSMAGDLIETGEIAQTHDVGNAVGVVPYWRIVAQISLLSKCDNASIAMKIEGETSIVKIV